MNMGRQYNTDNEMFVLQAIAYRIHSFRQVTRRQTVLDELRAAARTEELFAGDAGKALFDGILAELEKQYLVRTEVYKGEHMLGLETEARCLETLDIEHML